MSNQLFNVTVKKANPWASMKVCNPFSPFMKNLDASCILSVTCLGSDKDNHPLLAVEYIDEKQLKKG